MDIAKATALYHDRVHLSQLEHTDYGKLAAIGISEFPLHEDFLMYWFFAQFDRMVAGADK